MDTGPEILFPVGLHLIEMVAKWWIWIFFSGLHNHVNDLFSLSEFDLFGLIPLGKCGRPL